MNDILDLTDQVASTALFGSIGIGKTFVALTLLHHNRTKVKFGRNRHFMRCDDLTNSLESFLERLSDAIGISRTTDIGQLRSHLESSPPLILLLDGVDYILDPLATEAEDILATIEEFGSYRHVCLLTTCRMYLGVPGFHHIEVPTLSGSDALDAFYGICHLDRSPVIDSLIARLDFHPLPIDLLATVISENWWDELTLLKVWDELTLPKVWEGDQNVVLKAQYQKGLKDVLGRSFTSPTIQNLGTAAREVLEAIATFPRGVEEWKLESTFPSITGVVMAVDVLCKFSLLYRQDGFVRMLSPFRFYFLDSTQRDDTNWDGTKSRTSLSPCMCYARRVTSFEEPPIHTRGNLKCRTSHAASRGGVPPTRDNGIIMFQSVMRSEHCNSDS